MITTELNQRRRTAAAAAAAMKLYMKFINTTEHLVGHVKRLENGGNGP
jgi:hypothetical protein